MKEKIEKWLDKYIEANKIVIELSKGPEDISTCTGYDDKKIHIYHGLEKLAFYLQATITYDPNWDSEMGRMSIRYKDHELFEIWMKPIL